MAQLQRRDGYAGTLDFAAAVPSSIRLSRDSVFSLLRQVAIFSVLGDDDIAELAAGVRPIELGPVERIIVQGRKGSSLFVLAEGSLQVLIRQKDSSDLPVATLEPGAVFGEMSLLTGAVRSATVRSTDPAVVYEIGQHQLAPLLQRRPAAIVELAALMELRLSASRDAADRYENRHAAESLAHRIRSFLFGSDQPDRLLDIDGHP
jgi:CRP-like cAMP-binding protein